MCVWRGVARPFRAAGSKVRRNEYFNLYRTNVELNSTAHSALPGPMSSYITVFLCWSSLSCCYLLADFELHRLRIVWKNNMDNAVGIHTNNIYCKVLNEKRIFFLRITTLKLLNANEGYSIHDCDSFKSTISVRGCHCGYLPWEPKSPATPPPITDACTMMTEATFPLKNPYNSTRTRGTRCLKTAIFIITENLKSQLQKCLSVFVIRN